MPHVLVLLALAAISLGVGFGAGWGARGATVHDQAFWLNRYDHSLKVTTIPPRGETVKAPQGSATLPPTGSVDLARFPGIADQGPVGQCQAVAAAEQVTFAYRKLHPKSWANFSWKFLYEQYGHGADQGSYLEGDLATIPTVGVPRLKQYPTPPFLPLNWPEPALDAYGHNLAADAFKNRFTVVVNSGSNYPGGGMGAVDWIKQQIQFGNAVNIDFPVYAGYFDNTPNVMQPTAGQTSYGGHANVVIGYDDNYQFPDGEVGAVRVQNQWGSSWKDHGRAWMSYNFVAENGWGIETVDIQAMKAGKPELKVEGVKQKPLKAVKIPQDARLKTAPDGGHKPVPAPPSPVGATLPHGHRVIVRSTFAKDLNNYDLAPHINWSARTYGLSAPGLLSILGAECGLYTHSTVCDRYGNWPDVSFGSCQTTVQTAGGFGIGTGTYASTEYVRNFENDPARCLNLAARVLRQVQRIEIERGCPLAATFPHIDAAWNGGPYQPCYAILFPSGQVGQNYAGYLPWWSYAVSRAIAKS